MNGIRELGYILRISVMALVIPIWIFITGFFLLNEEYLYGIFMLFFGILLVYGAYMNFKRIIKDKNIDDERMKIINRKSSSNAFWTIINTVIFLTIFQSFLVDILPITNKWLINYDSLLFIGLGFISYFGFRTYYLYRGPENEFWRFN